MPYPVNKINQIAAKAEKTKRINAFAVTSLCGFVLSCLIWPLTASEFRSVAAIHVAVGKDVQSRAQLEQSLARIIREETLDDRLETIVSQIEVAGKLHSKQIEFRDHVSMREALHVSIGERDYGYDFRLAFDGQGGEDEQELVKMLALRIAIRLNPDLTTRSPKESESKASAQSLVRLQSQQAQSFEMATWIVDQIGNDLKSVKLTLSRLGDGAAGLANDASENTTAGSQFQFASSKRVVEKTVDLTNTIESIDLQSLRDVLDEMRKRMDAQTNLIKNDSPVLSGEGIDSRIIVSNPNRVETRPLDSTPSGVGMCLLGLASVIIGSVVAWKLQPFESRGFENARSIGRVLGVPVVAQIRSIATSENTETKKRRAAWANQVAMGSGLLLIGLFVAVAGFMLINPEVRDAFYENPMYGCTKIFRIFAGY